ncbi:MAG: nucleotidyl transferase AbiEii/AbiGii toxin family protein [Kofleriaceae bacterium]
MDYDLTRRVLEALHQHGVAYKVFGAVALNLHGLARATEDLDIFIAPDATNVERLRGALRAVFEDPCIDEITAADLLGDYPAVQYVPPNEGFHIDILTRLGERFGYDALESETVDFDGVPVTIVTARQLYEMKKDTIRAKDRGDAEALARRFKLKEEP